MFSISRLHQLMKALPRGQFDALVKKHQADKHSKGFGSWSQLIAMVYGQLSGASSLRVLEAGYNSQNNHHYHLGTRTIRRTTLSDANRTRTPDVFADTARLLMSQAKRQLRRDAEELLYLLDSTSLTLKGPGFDVWTQGNSTRNTQGIKLHLLYDALRETPVQHSFTPANVNDRDEGIKLPIEAGAVYVFDKGYCDYTWWHHIQTTGAYFVTRFKRNAALQVHRSQAIPTDAVDTVLADEVVIFSNRHPAAGRKNPYQVPLRRVTVARADHPTPLVLATNDLSSPALEVAARYKARWGIELFFKWIKQHLKIKTLLGRSENAVHIQILTALITYLLLALFRQASAFKGSLWALLAELRASLFQRPTTAFFSHRRRCQDRFAIQQIQSELFA
jgi:putative transposase